MTIQAGGGVEIKRLETLAPDDRKTRIEAVRRSLVQKAVQDIYLLVAHLARTGKTDEGVLGKSLEVAEKAALGDLTPQDEATFWQTYANLTAAAMPTHVDALYLKNYAASIGAYGLADDPNVNETLWKHGWFTRFTRICASVTFLATLIIVGYLAFIDSITGKINDLRTENRLLHAGETIGTQVEAAAALLRREARNGGGNQDPPQAGGVGVQVPGGADGVKALIDGRRAEIGLMVCRYQETLSRYSISGLLQEQPSEAGTKGKAPADKAGAGAGTKEGAQQDKTGAGAGTNEDVQLDKAGAGVGTKSCPGAGGTDKVLEDVSLLQADELPLRMVVDKFILPFFAALLGVFVFMLRTWTDQQTRLAFSATEFASYMPRIILGVIGGIVVSWFPSTDTAGTLNTLGPTMLAFVVGYSIEIFFNILDAVIKALGADRKAG